MSVADEFSTVDLILASKAETRGVDAFALTLIKMERQLRRLFTFLVYQSPSFSASDVISLRNVLGENTKIYVGGFLAGFDQLYSRSLRELVGDDYDGYLARIEQATGYRNKIFHGQLTDRSLSREELIDLVADLRRWCTAVAGRCDTEFGYDGFARNSFRKSAAIARPGNLRQPLQSLQQYATFLTTLERIQVIPRSG